MPSDRDSRLIDLTLLEKHQTDRGLCVRETEDGKDIWLPLSQVEVVRKTDGTIEVTLPEWLALERGLI